MRKKILCFSLAVLALALCGAGAWLAWSHYERKEAVVEAERARAQVFARIAWMLAEQKKSPVLAMLRKSCEAMKGGVWRVQFCTGIMDETGKLYDVHPTRNAEGVPVPACDVDFAKDGVRVTGNNGASWSSSDGGKSWVERMPGQASQVGYFSLPWSFLDDDRNLPNQDQNFTYYRILGTETHDGEKWLHIQVTPAGDCMEGVHFWLQLDKTGNAVSVRRCAWSSLRKLVFENHEIDAFIVEDFTRVTGDEGAGAATGKITSGL